MYQISRTHLIGYLVEDGITSSVNAKHTFSRTSLMLRFLWRSRIGYVRRDLSSIQWKAAIKEAEWQKCAAPRLVYDLTLFEPCMHVYVRTTYD